MPPRGDLPPFAVRLRACRCERQWSLAETADRLRRRSRETEDGVECAATARTVWRWEHGVYPSARYRRLLCLLYDATPEQLDLRQAVPEEGRYPGEDDVNRREFITGVVGVATIAVDTPSLAWLDGRRLGGEDVERFRRELRLLGQLDAQYGGGVAYPLAMRLSRRLQRVAESASYGPESGHALHELLSETAMLAGWVAYDTGRQEDARRWWLEATQRARLADATWLEAIAMAYMSLQAGQHDRPREAVSLAQAARSTANGRATPSLTAFLFAREALGHARAKEPAAARAALRRVYRARERDHQDDPIDYFVRPANLPGHEAQVALALGDLRSAETAARVALNVVQPAADPRNHALYQARLADVLIQRGEIDEGVAVATQAASTAASLDSARVRAHLAAVSRGLERYQAEPQVADFLATDAS